MSGELARRRIRLAALAAIRAAGIAVTIDSPGDWSSQPEKMPALMLRTPRVSKEALVRGPPEFTTTVAIEIETRVWANSGPAAQDAIEAFDYLVEQALFTNHDLVAMVQQFAVDQDTEIESAGRVHNAGTKWLIRCELVEVFDPIEDAPAALQPVAVPFEGMNIHADLTNLYDRLGAYLNAPFPTAIQPAPRTSGPDGRDEGGLQFNFPPQE